MVQIPAGALFAERLQFGGSSAMQSNELYPRADSFEETLGGPSASTRRWSCTLVEFVHEDNRDTPSRTALGAIFRELED